MRHVSTYFVAYTNVLEIPPYPASKTASIVKVTASYESVPQTADPACPLSVDCPSEGSSAPSTCPVVRIVPASMPQGPAPNIPELLSAPSKVPPLRSSGFPESRRVPTKANLVRDTARLLACTRLGAWARVAAGRRAADVARRKRDFMVMDVGVGSRVKPVENVRNWNGGIKKDYMRELIRYKKKNVGYVSPIPEDQRRGCKLQE